MRVHNSRYIYLMVLSVMWLCLLATGAQRGVRNVPIADGWAKSSVNTVIFRRDSVVTDDNIQYAAFYDPDGYVVLAKRRLNSQQWEIKKTRYKGNAKDAHNSISIMVDGAGYLHMSWDHHIHPLRYCRSVAPGSLELTDKMPMTGRKETKVTYPEFYKFPDGNLLFLYRDGRSGSGNLMMNYYDVATKKWSQLHDTLIDGEGKRNAYWQLAIDVNGTIHLSWVWRETADVVTNHDICYARSTDKGKTWQKTSGQKYKLPITQDSAEYACYIPQKSQLINQTSMCADSKGRPYIATFWRPSGTKKVTQFHVVYHDGQRWQTMQVSQRKTSFSLSGMGTKRSPISRPQIVADAGGITDKAYMIFRDAERGNKVSVAICDDLRKKQWNVTDLTTFPVGQWEPSYDSELWKSSKMLHIFVQKVGQGDGGKIEDIGPQAVSILEWNPAKNIGKTSK